jgi:hypothetical protein
MRAAESEAALAETPWLDATDDSDITLPTGEWMQYRLALGAPDGCGTPRVSEVRVT